MVRDYQPIENYGVIGDLNTAALVGLHGSIDFMCFPDFDSPSIFAAILDKEKGGYFEITPLHEEVNFKQMYLPDTNVLMTRFLSPQGVGEVTDFMPVEEIGRGHILIRRVKNVTGRSDYRMKCCPRFNYARTKHRIEKKNDHELLFISEDKDGLVLRLRSNVPLHIKGEDAHAEFTLDHNQTAEFLLERAEEEQTKHVDLVEFINKSLYDTVNYWQRWMGRSNYNGRWSEIVHRSALVLKLFTSKKYGSIVAAPTFGLPEKIGDSKNWDYRYNWIRDTAFTLYALIRLGYTREAGSFVNWLQTHCMDINKPGGMGLMYRLNGSRDLTEFELNHLDGYKGSKPVRIGNGAFDQLQLDIYGELMDAVYLYNKFGEPISYDFWNSLSGQIDWLCDNWEQPDEGIWEVRGGRHEFLYSRLMSWVAVDRAVRLCGKRSFPLKDKWVHERDRMYNSIFTDFWDDKRKTFTQSKGSNAVDASTLLMPLVRFISPYDKRWLSTMRAIEEDLVTDSLVYRYKIDEDVEALHEGEGTFSLCTFWYVECLSRSGQLHKARFYFEKMLGYANHLGLYAEELSFEGHHLGNFPQAFTHLGLISAAYNLDQRLNDSRNKEVNDVPFDY